MDIDLITEDNNNEFNTNCLSLTIRKDYRLTIVSNKISAVKRMFFKILVNFGMLNFFNMLF